MKRWRAHGAFLLTLALMAGPTAAGQGKGQDDRGRGKGRAPVERAEKGGKQSRQAQAQRPERRASRAAAADRGEQREQRRQQRAAPQERRADHAPARADRAQRQDRREERPEQRVERRGNGGKAEQRRERPTADRPARPAQARGNRERVEQLRAAEARREARQAQLRDEMRRRQAPGVNVHQRLQREAMERHALQDRHRRQLGREPVTVQRERSGAAMRFRGLDRNGDGRIGRAEWRGNGVSFANHDWNGDGVLSGAEVVPGARRGVPRDRFVAQQRLSDRERMTAPERPTSHQRVSRVEWNGVQPLPLAIQTVRRVDRLPRLTLLAPVDTSWHFDENRFERQLRTDGFQPVRLLVRRMDLTPIDRALVVERFAVLDSDQDRFVTWNEWTGPRPLFRDLDGDGDDRLVFDDFDDVRYVESVRDTDRERYVAYHLLDVDDDGMVAPWEWTGDLDVFFLVDVDDDGVVTLAEYLGLVQPRHVPLRTAFGGDLDHDGDGNVETVEWYGDPLRFARLDLDHDGELDPLEAVVGWFLRS